jgi:hypothetical protein
LRFLTDNIILYVRRKQMSEKSWEVVEVVSGAIQAEILRGLLEAQGVPVVLSQEGAGHFGYPTTIGRLGRVEILVPADSLSHAREVMQAYRAGDFESQDTEEG